MANGHGGAREGAGRKRKGEKFATEIQAAERRIADRLPELVDNLFALAAGVMVQDVDSKGMVDVYERPPDRQANQYLIDRVLGRPSQAVEFSDADGETVTPVLFYIPKNNRDGDGDGQDH